MRISFALLLLTLFSGWNPIECQEIPGAAAYLIPGNRVAFVDSLTFPEEPDRLYIRNERFGRFVAPEERGRVVSKAYFDSIRNGSRFGSSLRSLLFLHADAQSMYPFRPEVDRQVRVGKIGLIALAALTFMEADNRSRRVRSAIRYINDSSRVTAFRAARTNFYIASAVALGFHGYTAVQAYRNYGHTLHGVDLEIPGRLEVPADDLLGRSQTQLFLGTQLSVSWTP